LALSEVLAIASRTRGAEQYRLLEAEPDGYSDGLCRPCAPHAPAHRTISLDPFFGIITIPISI
jgi:hypothetical protein